MARRKRKRSTNGVLAPRQLPSGRWQGRVRDEEGNVHSAPRTFDTKLDAEAWAKRQRQILDSGTWVPPTKVARHTFGDYAESWLASKGNLRPKSVENYRRLIDRHLVPTFGDLQLTALSTPAIRAWHAKLAKRAPASAKAAYDLMRNILNTALDDELILSNPCRIKGASKPRRKAKVQLTIPEVNALVEQMPDRYRATVLLAFWACLRQGEVFGLNRSDFTIRHDGAGRPVSGKVTIRRAVSRITGAKLTGDPKSDAGFRDISIPRHILPDLEHHLATYAAPGPDGFVFPAVRGGRMAPSTLYGAFYPAREAIGRPDIRFHDLRHAGATHAAQAGATLAELQARIGHSTPAMAMGYQHAMDGREELIAERLADMAENNVVPLRRAR